MSLYDMSTCRCQGSLMTPNPLLQWKMNWHRHVNKCWLFAGLTFRHIVDVSSFFIEARVYNFHKLRTCRCQITLLQWKLTWHRHVLKKWLLGRPLRHVDVMKMTKTSEAKANLTSTCDMSWSLWSIIDQFWSEIINFKFLLKLLWAVGP